MATIAAAGITALTVSEEARPVVLPLVSLISLAVLYVAAMIHRDRRVPVFEIGSMFVAVVTIYGAVPLLNFMAGGLAWTIHSDNRNLQYASTPEETGAFAWNYVALLGSFMVAYLAVRRRPKTLEAPLGRLGRPQIIAVVATTIGLILYFWVMGTLFDLSYTHGYAALQAGAGAGGRSLPLVVRQISHNLYGVLGVEKQMLLVVLISGWRSPRNRLFVGLFVAYELITVLTRFGARTELVMVVLTAVLLYERFVRKLSLKFVTLSVVLGLAGVITYGLARQTTLMRGREDARSAPFASANNEFQVIFATAFDLTQRREQGWLTEVPWQIYASDLYMIIPSQLLPFDKVDPSLWYLNVVNDHSGMGYMFGILAQSAVGWGWPEVLIRGALLGAIFAWIHRAYTRHQSSFWATAAYVFLIGWTYYAFRSTTLYWVYFFVYRFIPAAVITWFVAVLVTAVPGAGRNRRQNDTAVPATPAHPTT